ncbi:MAG: hypothetical protein JNM33_05030 [Rubrivivax sp.]|nr:hypothetical protein [Rubrivivax sp.]
MSPIHRRMALIAGLAAWAGTALAQAGASAPVATPVRPQTAAASASTLPAAAPPAAASAAASGPVRIRESADAARANAVIQRARAIGDRNASVARSGGPPPSAELLRAKTDEGYAYLSGGVTVSDRRTMRDERNDYSLWVATVARPSGAFLSDALLTFTRAGSKQPFFARTMDGPWLMMALPPGRYEVKAVLPGENGAADRVVKETVTIGKKGLRQAVLRFASTVEVAPDGQDPEDVKMFLPKPPPRATAK